MCFLIGNFSWGNLARTFRGSSNRSSKTQNKDSSACKLSKNVFKRASVYKTASYNDRETVGRWNASDVCGWGRNRTKKSKCAFGGRSRLWIFCGQDYRSFQTKIPDKWFHVDIYFAFIIFTFNFYAFIKVLYINHKRPRFHLELISFRWVLYLGWWYFLQVRGTRISLTSYQMVIFAKFTLMVCPGQKTRELNISMKIQKVGSTEDFRKNNFREKTSRKTCRNYYPSIYSTSRSRLKNLISHFSQNKSLSREIATSGNFITYADLRRLTASEIESTNTLYCWEWNMRRRLWWTI